MRRKGRAKALYISYYENLQVFNEYIPVCLPKMLHTQYIKRYKRKYLGWLQGENRKLHKISRDKNLTESVHRKISHNMRNSLAASCGFSGCTKLSFTQSCSQSYNCFSFWFRIAMQKCWLLDLFLWFSSLHLWLAWQPITKPGKGLWSAPKLRFFMYLSFNLYCHGFHKILPHSWLVSMIK